MFWRVYACNMQYISNWYTLQENQNTNIVELRMNLRLLEVHETNKNLKPEFFTTLNKRYCFINGLFQSPPLQNH